MVENYQDDFEVPKPMPCFDCGAREGRNAWFGSCMNHEDWVECSYCGCLYPLVSGVTFFDETDHSVGIYGFSFDCPGCDSSEYDRDPVQYTGVQ